MKAKTRVTLVVICAACLAFIFLFWPNLSFQSYLFEQVLQLLDFEISSATSLEKKCTTYFQTLDKISQLTPSTSRFLSYAEISNHIDHLRVYLRCFVENDVPNQAKHEYSRLLLPMFSEELPVLSNIHQSSPIDDPNTSFWRKYIKVSKGSGIVISLHESGSFYAERLLHVLIELGNELPIQFVHEKPISEKARSRILKAASATESTQLVQNIEFIDTQPVLRENYRSVFKGYNNKWLAALFSNFENIILMDLDVVPFVRPSEMLESNEFIATGAYFFRDRELLETISQKKYDFLCSLIPKNKVFNIQVDEKLLTNNFFRFRSKHVMESGMVVMHRPSHISGLLISLSLQYWRKSGSIMYGDKDLFWLGQLISGNLDFHFNENSAAAIGVLDDGRTICSSQLGHLSKENNLLWVNGGLLYCKKSSWYVDFFMRRYMRQKFESSLKTMKAGYSRPIILEEYVLPATIGILNPEASLTNSKLRSNFNKNYNYGCGGIFYCARPDHGGKRALFTSDEKSIFTRVSQAWNKFDKNKN